jgi:plasmid stabilization system protein ParE
MSRSSKRPIHWAISARRDYYGVLQQIAADNTLAADRWGAAIEAKVELLLISPRTSGRLRLSRAGPAT